jgi:hypothetical protein
MKVLIAVLAAAMAATTSHSFSLLPSAIQRPVVTTARLYSSPSPPQEDDESSWDEDVDYDKVWSSKDENMMPNAAWDDVIDKKDKEVDLGLPPAISELIDAETAAEIKEEAREIIEKNMQQGMEQLAKMRSELNKDIGAQKRSMERQSEKRAKREEERLLNKIDQITGKFLSESKAVRESTKMAAVADAAMEGQGIDVGSWGTLGGGAVVTMDGGAGLLGSVENAKRQQQQQEDAEVELPPADNRILIIADESGVRFGLKVALYLLF